MNFPSVRKFLSGIATVETSGTVSIARELFTVIPRERSTRFVNCITKNFDSHKHIGVDAINTASPVASAASSPCRKNVYTVNTLVARTSSRKNIFTISNLTRLFCGNYSTKIFVDNGADFVYNSKVLILGSSVGRAPDC